jgi:nucleoside-diphosphate-sugar epimerase
VADVRRLGDEVGWTPAIDLEEGLEQTIGWWREAEAST